MDFTIVFPCHGVKTGLKVNETSTQYERRGKYLLFPLLNHVCTRGESEDTTVIGDSKQ